jgi:hypothetical protein
MIGMRKPIGIAEALGKINPEAKWSVRDNSYDQIEWFSEDISQPTKEEVDLKMQEMRDSEGMDAVREIRNWYLQQSDWTQGQDIRSIRGPEWSLSWDKYRQDLRNLTSSGIKPYFDDFDMIVGVVWPEKPED